MAEEDWDLQAVVRGCSTATTASSCSSSSSSFATVTVSSSTSSVYPLSGFEPHQDGNFFCLQDLFFEPRTQSSTSGIDQELHNLYKPFFPKSLPPLSPQNIPISPLSVLGGLQDLSQQQQQQQPPKEQKQQLQQVYEPKQSTLPIAAGSRSCGSNGPPSHRSKRRKNQLKRVCQVPAEALSSDSWSWRKYGQKPIKGSPYPRGYYRCSTSKGCMARKQVERNRADPGMFIVTYTSEHNHPMPTHRNSLAGSTRTKPPSSQTTNSGEPSKPCSSPPVSPSASLSSARGRQEMESSKEDTLEDEDDDVVNGYEMAVDDDFFTGLEEFTVKPTVEDLDFFPDHLSMEFPWLTNNATTTTTAASRG